MTDTVTGAGWAVGSIDGMGDGPGFRKVRRELDVKAFGVNAVVMPPGYASGPHYHDRQEELYLVHRGTVEFTFGEGDDEEFHELGPGGLARVDAATIRRFRNTSDTEEAVYLCVGGADGYVGRDGRTVGDEAAPLKVDVDVEPGRLGEAEALVEPRRLVRVRVEVRELGPGGEAALEQPRGERRAHAAAARAGQHGDAREIERRAARAVGAQRVRRAGGLAVEGRPARRRRPRRPAAARASACCRRGRARRPWSRCAAPQAGRPGRPGGG